jgi:hypothetical protein
MIRCSATSPISSDQHQEPRAAGRTRPCARLDGRRVVRGALGRSSHGAAPAIALLIVTCSGADFLGFTWLPHLPPPPANRSGTRRITDVPNARAGRTAARGAARVGDVFMFVSGRSAES